MNVNNNTLKNFLAENVAGRITFEARIQDRKLMSGIADLERLQMRLWKVSFHNGENAKL